MTTDRVIQMVTYVVWAAHKIEVCQHLIDDPESFPDSLRIQQSDGVKHVGSQVVGQNLVSCLCVTRIGTTSDCWHA